MATYTTNLNLKKPAQSDKIRIADINNNMDDIDAAFGAVGSVSLAAQLNAIQDSIAIVANGNAHAAINEGQFVYVKGHETLSTGLYVATSNISENGTLSSGNLAADTAGGLNALSDKIGKNTLGSSVDLSGYTSSSNVYTFPSDGYVRIVSGDTVNDAILAYISSSIRIQAKTQVANYAENNSIFVRKGMNVYIGLNTGNRGTAYYWPLT